MPYNEQEIRDKFRDNAMHQSIDNQNDNAEAIDIHEVIRIVTRRWRVMIVAFAVVVGLGMLYTLTRRPMYESSAKIVVASAKGGASAAFGAMGGDVPLLGDLQALTRSRSVETQVEVVSSPDLLDEVYRRIGPRLRHEGFRSKRIPEWACKVSSKRATDIITITCLAYTKEAASKLANTVAETYFERDLEQVNSATKQARKYAGRKMVEAEKDLIAAHMKLAKFKQSTGFIAPEVQLGKAAEQMAQLSLDLSTAEAESAAGSEAVESLSGQLPAYQQTVVASTTIAENPQFSAIAQKLTELTSERVALLQEFTPKSPEIKIVDGKIAKEEQRLKNVTRMIVGSTTNARNPIKDNLTTKYADAVTSLAANRSKAGAIKSHLNSLETRTKLMPETERQYTEQMRNVQMLEKSYEMLSAKYHALLFSEESVLPSGMMISKARQPLLAAYPRMKTNGVMFIILGTMVAVMTALFVERLDSSVHDQALVEKTTGLSTLSIIPEAADANPNLLGNLDKHSALLESYRILRNNIAFSAVGRNVTLLAITSPGPGEGKSTTAANLAVAMAMEGKKILLVDCDLRRPSLKKKLNISGNVGFTNVVAGTADLEDAIVPTECEGLYCMPSGPIPPNPTEFINSRKSRELFERITAGYDLVILDCPPSSGLSDMQVISTIVDGIVLVICKGKTLKPHLEMTTRSLSNAEAPVMGFVMNRVDSSQQSFSYNYYYNDEHDASTREKKRSKRKAA